MGIPPVEINFQAKGIRDVQRAFQNIEQTIAKLERAEGTSARRSGSVREREYARVAKTAERSERDQVREVEKAEKAKTRAAERGAHEMIRAYQKADRVVAQAMREGVREFERSERDKTRSAEQWLRKREKEELASGRRMKHANEAVGRALGGAAGRGITAGAGTVARGATALVGGLSQLGGGFSIAGSVEKRLSAERNAALLANSAYIPGKNERQDPAKLLAQAKAVGIATNMDTNELLEGTQSYVAKSSDLKGGMANMEFFAKVAKGTGTSFSDVTKTAGILRTQNDKLDDKSMKSMLLKTIAQGKSGAVEFSDLAKVAGKVTKTSSMYGMDQTQAQGALLGLSQFAIKTSGGADEAATVVSNFGADTLKKRGVLEKANIHATDKDGNLKDPSTIIQDIFTKTNGNMGQIQDLGYGQRSMKLFAALAPTFRDAGDALGAKATKAERTKAGAAAVAAEIGDMSKASYSEEDLNADFSNVMKTNSEQLESAFNVLRESVADALVPELQKLIPMVRELTPKFLEALKGLAKFTEWFLDNPIKGIGVVMAASVGKEVAAAGIGKLLETALTTKLGQGIAIVSAAIAIEQAGEIAIAKMIEAKDKSLTDAVGGEGAASNEMRAIQAKVKDGTATPEDIMKAKAVAAATEKNVNALRNEADPTKDGILKSGVKGLTSLTMGKEGKDALASEAKAQQETLKATIAALAKLNTAIAASETAMKEHAGASAGANPADPKRNQSMAARGGASK